MKKLRLLFFGLGSIGQRHARLIKQYFPHEIVAFRTFQGQQANILDLPEMTSWAEVDAHSFDVAFITNPTPLHVETAVLCAERGMHLFIEKPIGCALEGLDKLLAVVEERALTTYVAYPLRFHAAVLALKKRLAEKRGVHANMVCAAFLPNFRPTQDYRKHFSALRQQGGGVLLEMSHELDLAEFLFGPVRDIKGQLTKLSSLTMDAEDTADLILTHDRVVTGIHLSFLAEYRRRYIEVDIEDGFLRVDLAQSQMVESHGGEHKCEDFAIDPDLMYINQLKYFFTNLENRDMDNALQHAIPLFKKIVELRETQNYGNLSHDLRPGGLAGS